MKTISYKCPVCGKLFDFGHKEKYVTHLVKEKRRIRNVIKIRKMILENDNYVTSVLECKTPSKLKEEIVKIPLFLLYNSSYNLKQFCDVFKKPTALPFNSYTARRVLDDCERTGTLSDIMEDDGNIRIGIEGGFVVVKINVKISRYISNSIFRVFNSKNENDITVTCNSMYSDYIKIVICNKNNHIQKYMKLKSTC